MSILDMMHGKVYTSIFDFMVDVLVACGVNVNEIINYLLREIYGIEASATDGIDGLYEKIKSGALEIDEQNEVLEDMENSIKVIFMGLLSSIFSCSALPILPNRVMDGPKKDNFKNDNGNLKYILNALGDSTTPFKPLIIPKSIIDPMGILDINPTSDDGRLFYAIEGGDKYYQKSQELKINYEEVPMVSTDGGSVTVTTKTEKEKYKENIGLYFDYVPGNDVKEDEIYIFSTKELPSTISITVKYTPYGGKASRSWDAIINKGERISNSKLILSPENRKGKKSIIEWVSINYSNGCCEILDKTDKIWIHLDLDSQKNRSTNFYNKWKDNGIHSLPWEEPNEETEYIISSETKTLSAGAEYIDVVAREEYVYVYNEISGDELNNIDFNKVERVNYVPTEDIDAYSPEYVVCYDGLNPNLLYKTFDMNAFLWYVLHKGMKSPQVEYNHMMWDSRISASKIGIGRKNAEEWNQWYNSKTSYTDEFKYFDSVITKESPIFPIMQLERQGTADNLFRIRIPSQRYLLPNIRTANINETVAPTHAFNASMYRYNWEYLNNIKILRPKLLIVGLLDSLLGFSVSTIKSTDINFTKKIIEAKLSSAIKSIIESNDMEVEDCYMTFSNDEVNAMLEEMLLSRYSGTMYGGETTTVREHDVRKYISMLDQINASASKEGNVSAISKLVTEVTVSPGTEGSIDYGLSVSTDGNLLKKLLWAIVMPILMSIFTPQVLLILYINLDLMGIVKFDEFLGQDFSKIVNLLMNKIFGLLKSIIIFIKDKIVELLLIYLYEKLLPLLIKYELILLLERIEYWLTILKAALACLPRFKFKINKAIGSIDNVDYADIVSTQDTPESTATC
jgi:hypothetical protein